MAQVELTKKVVGRRYLCVGYEFNRSTSALTVERLKGLGLLKDVEFSIWGINRWLRLVILQLDSQLVGLRWEEFDQLKLKQLD